MYHLTCVVYICFIQVSYQEKTILSFTSFSADFFQPSISKDNDIVHQNYLIYFHRFLEGFFVGMQDLGEGFLLGFRTVV